MNTKILNKKGITILLAIILVLVVAVTSVVSVYMITSNSAKTETKLPSEDGNLSGVADSYKGVKPLEDGAVPGGSEAYKQQFAGNSDWVAINNEQDMRNWLGNNNGKNAYLNADLNDYYPNVSGEGNGAIAGHNSKHDVGAGKIFDGCGYNIRLTRAAEWAWYSNTKDSDGYYHMGLFASSNYGTMRNINIVNTQQVRIDDAHHNNRDEFQKYTSGILVALNQGHIYNCKVTVEKQFTVEATRTNYAGNESFVGAIAGRNAGGTIANCTVLGGGGSLKAIGAGDTWLNWGTRYYSDGAGAVGGVVGLSENATEYNITIDAGSGLSFHAELNKNGGYAANGGAVGRKKGGVIFGVLVKGSIGNNAVSTGVAVGNSSDATQLKGIYSDGTAGVADSWMVGNGGDGFKANFTLVRTNLYGVMFDKPAVFDDVLKVSNNLVIVPSTGLQAHEIVWSVKYAGASSFDINNLAPEMIRKTDVVKIPHVLTKVKDYINVEYGAAAELERFDIAEKTYNGQPQGIESDKLIFTDLSGGTYTRNYSEVSSMTLTYDSASAAPTNKGDYPISLKGTHIDNTNKILFNNNNDITGLLVINAFNLTYDPSKISLNSTEKEYDTTTDLPLNAEINGYPTGIGNEAITWQIEVGSYTSPNVGVGNKIVLSVYFDSNNSIINGNYTIDNLTNNVKTIELAGNITPAPFSLEPSLFSVDNNKKVYDGTTDFKGNAEYPTEVDTFLGEVLIIESATVAYNSRDVKDANAIVFSVVMKNDTLFKNYTLMDDTIEVAGSITPYDLLLNWDSFSKERFYNADGTSNVRKVYDGTMMLDPALMVVNHAFATELGENILIKFTAGALVSKDVADRVSTTMTLAVAEIGLGSMTMPDGSTQEITSDWGNYSLKTNTVSTTVAIDAKEITVTDEAFSLTTLKEYDGTTELASNIVYNTISGVNGETITLTDISGKYVTKNVSDNNQIEISFKQADRNYKLNIAPVDNIYSHYMDATITPYNVSVLPESIHAATTKIYDGTKDYKGDPITIDSITVALTGGEETIDIAFDRAEYAQAATYTIGNTLDVYFTQANTNFSLDSDVVKLSATIDKFALKLSADNFELTRNKVYDGNNNAIVKALPESIIGVNSEVVTISNVTAKYNDINVAGVNSITITYTVPDQVGINKNYILGDVDGILVEENVSIQPKEFVITNEMFTSFDATKVYDGNTSFVTVINTNQILTGINEDELVLNITEQLFNSANVAEANTLTVTFNNDNTNYTINTNVVFVATITPYFIDDIQATAFTVNGVKVYDGTTNVATDNIVANSYATNVNNESVTFTLASANYNSQNAATASSITLTFTVDNANYALGNVSELTYTASITARDITVSLDNLDITTVKDYDKTNTAAIFVKNGGIASGVVVNDIEELVSLDTLSATYNSALVADANLITIMFGSDNTNYNITNASEVLTTSGTINRLAVTLDTNNFVIVNQKEYDGNNVATVTSYNINVNDEALTLDEGYAAVYSDKNAATGKTITISFAATWDNHVLTSNTVEYNDGAITPKAIAVEPTVFTYIGTKVYDATTNYVADAITAETINTGIGEEFITLVIGTANYNSKNVAEANAIIINISQTDTNYTIADSVSVDANITPYQVTDDMSDMARYALTTRKDFDGSDSAAVSINDGFENINGLLNETFTYSVSAKYATSIVGTNINITIFITSNDGNYVFSIAEFLASSEGSISSATLTITLENFTFEKTKQYDGTTKVVITGYSIIGVSGEEVMLAEDYRGEFNDAAVGMGKTITIYFTPAEAGYNFDVSELTYTPAEGEDCGITKKTVELTNEHFNYLNTKVYDGTTDYDNDGNAVTPKGAVATGVGSETIEISVDTAAQYFSKNVGDGNYIFFTASMVEHESYEIVGTVNLDATITAAPITVDSTSFSFNTTKVYDGNTTVTIEQLTINGVNGETITLDNIIASYDIKDVGATTITITFENANANYALNTLTIEVQEDVAITQYIIANTGVEVDVENTKTYDGNDIAQLNGVTINVTTGETVDVSDGVATYDNKNAGVDKAITVTFGITDANYKLGFDNIVFNDGVINAKEITVGVDDITVELEKTYDGTTAYTGKAAEHGIISGTCGGDVITLTFGDIVYNSKDVATANSLTVNFTQPDANYTLTNNFVDKVANIIAKVITVSEQDFTFNKSRVYNNSVDVAIGQKAIAGVNGEEITLGTLFAKFNSKDVLTANAIIITVALGENEQNYSLAILEFVVADELVFLTPYTITTEMVTSEVVKSKTYDANATALVNGVLIDAGFGEEITAIDKVASYNDKNAATDKTITLTFAIDNGNYTLGFESIVFTDGVITAKGIDVATDSIIVDTAKTYDGTTDYVGEPASHTVIEGTCGDDVITLVFGDIVYNSKDVAAENNNLKVNFTLEDTNYILNNSSVEKVAAISPYLITLTQDNFVFDRTRVYNNSTAVSIVQGVISGVTNETLDLGTLTAEYDFKDVATATQIIITVALKENDTNYQLLNSTISVSDGVAITPFVLGVDKINFSYNSSKVYDGNTDIGNIKPIFVLGFSDDDLSLSSVTGKYDDKNVNVEKGISFTFSVSNSNYMLTDDAESLTKDGYYGTITALAITPNPGEFVVEQSRQYTGDNTATATTTTTISGIGEEKLVIAGTKSEYLGDDFNVGDGKTIRAYFGLSGDAVNGNYIITQNYVDIEGCEIVKKQITVTADDFEVAKTKVYDGDKSVKATAKPIQGVLEEIVTLSITSSIYNEKDVTTANAIRVVFVLVSNDINSNYVITNENNYIIYDQDVSITAAQLTVEYGYTHQSFRNSFDPASRVTLNVTSGAVKNESPKVVLNDKIVNAGVYETFDIKATSLDTNYEVANGTQLILDVFAKDGSDCLIENLEDFKHITTNAEYLAYSFKQTKDIDVNYATLKGIKGAFSGTYDGNDKFIKNFFMYDESLFETISGTVKNLAVVNATIISYNNNSIGGIAKEIVAGGTIKNAVFEGSIYLAGEGIDGAYVGGIAATNAGTITSVKVFADIVVKANNTNVGGIVGLNSGSITADTKVTAIDINRVFVQIQSYGTDNTADAVMAKSDSGNVDKENTWYLNNASFKTSDKETINIVNSTAGKGVDFSGFFATEPAVFGELTMLMLINQYHNDYGLIITPNMKLEINNAMDYQLLGQYNYLNAVFKSNIAFFIHEDVTPFNKLQIGNIDMNGFTLDERVLLIFKYMLITVTE